MPTSFEAEVKQSLVSAFLKGAGMSLDVVSGAGVHHSRRFVRSNEYGA